MHYDELEEAWVKVVCAMNGLAPVNRVAAHLISLAEWALCFASKGLNRVADQLIKTANQPEDPDILGFLDREIDVVRKTRSLSFNFPQ